MQQYIFQKGRGETAGCIEKARIGRGSQKSSNVNIVKS